MQGKYLTVAVFAYIPYLFLTVADQVHFLLRWAGFCSRCAMTFLVQVLLVLSSVAESKRFDADPDPTSHADADPKPTFFS